MKTARLQVKPQRTTARVSSSVFICVALAIAVFVAYWRVFACDFVNFDDFNYVRDNPFVRRGLSWAGAAWAFTSLHASNWHPLTWLSHMLDCTLYGLKPGGHHLTNVLLHAANSVVLFLTLKRLTAATWRSAFVAALFALHPVHVESVAWIAERKDVLSTLFFLLTIWAYAGFSQIQNSKSKTKNYLLALLFFALGLMSKPMVVTLPFVLLLLDFWPLKRFTIYDLRFTIFRLVREKIPFLILAAASSVVTFVAQRRTGTVSTLTGLPVSERLANALVAYAEYLRKMFCPTDLSVFYPHPIHWPVERIVVAAAVLILVSVLVVWIAWRRSHLAVGWLWFLGTLVPAIGIVQVGMQAFADRYTYIPSIGIFLMISWGAADLVANWSQRRITLAIATSVVLIAYGALTFQQTKYWKDSVTLFSHALDVTKNNALAHNNLGAALGELNRPVEAAQHYAEAVRIKPDYALAHNNFGYLLAMDGKLDAAVAQFRAALASNPRDADAMINLGNTLAVQGKLDEAIEQFNAGLKLEPKNSFAQGNLGNALSQKGRLDEAAQHYAMALTLDPKNTQARLNFGVLLARQGKPTEAREQFAEVLRIEPNNAEAKRLINQVSSTNGNKSLR